ncbi:MAG: hypothetical protein LAT83_13640 [Kiritimatiellae bacterium]|nr:hypothetical protein [Kiritimatiellia bacterium]
MRRSLQNKSSSSIQSDSHTQAEHTFTSFEPSKNGKKDQAEERPAQDAPPPYACAISPLLAAMSHTIHGIAHGISAVGKYIELPSFFDSIDDKT